MKIVCLDIHTPSSQNIIQKHAKIHEKTKSCGLRGKKHDVNIKLSMGRHSRHIIQNISIQNDSKMS